MRRFLVLCLLASLAVVGTAQTALGCSCALLDPTTALDQSDAAFVGTLVEAPDPTSFEDAIWVFDVDEWVKGDLGEQVGVHSGPNGASCGFEIAVGDQIGVFLYNDNGRPSGGLCSTTSPEAMLGAGQPLVFDGTGPPTFLVAADSGRTRLAVLDARGRLLAAAGDERFGWSVSVCPEDELIVDVIDTEITVRDLSLAAVRTVDAEVDGSVEQIWCLDAGAERLLGQVSSEDGSAYRLQVLGGDVVYEGTDYLMDVSPSHVAVVSHPANGTLMTIDLATEERTPLGPVSNPGSLVFSPRGDKLLVTSTAFFDDGHSETVATVFDVASGEVVWTSEPLTDTSVTGWVDEDRLVGDYYPIDADTPTGVLIETPTGETVEFPSQGWGYQTVGDSLVSVTPDGLAVTSPDGVTAPLAPLPTPAHRLVAVLDPDAEITAAPTPTTLPEAVAVTEPAPEAVAEASFPTAVAVAAGAGVALILAVGWAAIRRQRPR